MVITVNGEQKQIDEGATLAALLAELRLSDKPCAVEVNRTLVPKREHIDRRIEGGDNIEIVTLVGGG